MYEEMLEIVKWWVSHLAFALLMNLAIFGGYHAYQWYKAEEVFKLDVSQLEPQVLSQLQKQIAEEVRFRAGK